MKTLLLAVAMLVTSGAFAKTVKLNGKTFNWHGSKVVGDDHKGTIKIKSGTVELDQNKVIKTGTVIVDMNSINNTDLEGEWKAKLEGHLKNEDFFNVKKHPEAKLVIKSVKKTKDHKLKVTGDLTIKGITKPVTFDAVQTPTTFRGEIVFDRTKWGIKYGSSNFFKLAADKTIKDDIKLNFDFKM